MRVKEGERDKDEGIRGEVGWGRKGVRLSKWRSFCGAGFAFTCRGLSTANNDIAVVNSMGREVHAALLA